jgi:Fe-Mn family superoxide dismutase
MSQYPDGIRNTAGGYWNHEFFWESLSPKESMPSEEFQKAINESFGSMEKMKEEFSANAASLFGSGWTWLIYNTANHKLEIINTSNQDNPYMDVVEKNGIPLLAIDVWEHAYYLKYQNKRPDYIANFWNIVNWKRVSERYAATMK